MKLRFIAMAALALLVPNTAMATDCSSLSGDVDSLACNVYHEARGEGLVGMLAVAHVTLNRAHSGLFPPSIKQVVVQKDQFSWYWDGNSDGMGEPEEAKKAQLVAQIAPVMYELGVLHELTGLTNDTMWFHSLKKTPGSMKRFDFVTQIGGHKFYKK